MNPSPFGLYDPARESSDCGVGFITRLDGVPTHDVIVRGDEALCSIPHRGGKSAEGVGDGAGVSIDLSVEFFSAITGEELVAGHFGVANCFVPADPDERAAAVQTVTDAIEHEGFALLLVRDVPVDHSVARPEAEQYQLPIVQWVFRAPEGWSRTDVDAAANRALLAVERVSYTQAAEARAPHAALYPLSLSARTQILKGRLNSGEVISYFRDLTDPRHSVRTLYFHTRFSTNTEPHPTMAQPFRLMAHNGELNTDRKNRLSDEALAAARTRSIVRPPGQSDSSRLDQTLQSRVFDDGLEIVEAVVTLMPPAWENDRTLTADVRDMLEYFSLYEEKNDGPAAVIFSDGDVVGARLDRLGLRPLRTVQTDEYLMVASESGQVTFPADEVVHRGRIEAGGMLVVDHRTGSVMRTDEVLRMLAARRDYGTLLDAARVHLDDLPAPAYDRGTSTLGYDGDLSLAGRYVAYSLNQESFRFMLDPMLATGSERISAMGYGNAINALSDTEGGMAKYFSQRFAQVTNPPLDSIREADGMSMRVALGSKPDGTGSASGTSSRQIVVDSPVLGHLDMVRLRDQTIVPLERFDMLYVPVVDDEQANADAVRTATERLAGAVVAFAERQGGIAVLTDRSVSSTHAPLPVILAVAAVNQRLIETGLRLRVSVVAESGQLPSSHHVATALGFGASAVYSLSARLRAEEKYPAAPAPAGQLTETDAALERFRKAAEKALAKTMGRVGLCTAESYIGGEFFEPNYLDTGDDLFARVFPHMAAPVGGVGFARIAQASTEWHERARSVATEGQVPLLGLFKERSDGAGHSFGVASVRGFGGMTEERPAFERSGDSDALRLLTLRQLDDSFGISDTAYRNTGYDRLSDAEIDAHRVTPGYVTFLQTTHDERSRRPAALRDVLALPADVTGIDEASDFARELGRFSTTGNASITVRGLSGSRSSSEDALPGGTTRFTLRLTSTGPTGALRHRALADGLALLHPGTVDVDVVADDRVTLRATGAAADLLGLLQQAPASVDVAEVQPAHEITRTLASGAMSHGALVATAHEAVAHGTNMVGGMSNSGEGGEHHSRYGTIRGSRIKQFASGRFGIWAGYLADPMLEELEIKIGQGAKPGEGGSSPHQGHGGHRRGPGWNARRRAHLAAAAPRHVLDRGPRAAHPRLQGRPGPRGREARVLRGHRHDRGRRREGRRGRHQRRGQHRRHRRRGRHEPEVRRTLRGDRCGRGAPGPRRERPAPEGHAPLLRCAPDRLGRRHECAARRGLVRVRHDRAHDARLRDGEELQREVPGGPDHERRGFEGDPRALAQYLLNIAHDVRQILARLGLQSLREARGRTDLLQLLDHPASVGRLDVRNLLAQVPEKVVTDPEYLEKDYRTGRRPDRPGAGRARRRARARPDRGRHRPGQRRQVGRRAARDRRRAPPQPRAAGRRPVGHPAVTTDDRGRRRLVDGA